MGGNAVASAKRMNLETYNQYCKEVLERFPFLTMSTIKSYATKSDFGDIDIVVKLESGKDLKKLILDEFKPTEKYNNGSVLSILYKDAQVDFIFCPAEEYEMTYHYLNFNDIGNLVGVTAHRQGLKFGHDGLWYIYRSEDNDRILDEILLTNDFYQAIEYVGFDVDRYKHGFNTLIDIFEFVKQSKFFDPHGFTLEHRSHAARIRDKKRKTYMEFMKYLNFTEPYQHSDKASWLSKHIMHFPQIKERMDIADKKEQRRLLYKEYVNGEKISELTGLSGKELGHFMSEVKNTFPIDDESLYWMPVEHVHELILEQYKKKGT